MKGITMATFIRWRKENGMPVPTKDDLRNISDDEVQQIYWRYYWKVAGCDKLTWPIALVHFDTAVNAGPGKAAELATASDYSWPEYLARRLEWYTHIITWPTFGAGWTNRMADLLREAG